MSYYNKHVHSASRLLVTDEKEVMQALVSSELKATLVRELHDV